MRARLRANAGGTAEGLPFVPSNWEERLFVFCCADTVSYTHLEQRLDPGLEYHFDTPCAVPHQKEMLLEAGFRSVEEVWRRKNTVVLVAWAPAGLDA